MYLIRMDFGVYKGDFECVPREDNIIKKGNTYKLSVDWTVGVEREPLD